VRWRASSSDRLVQGYVYAAYTILPSLASQARLVLRAGIRRTYRHRGRPTVRFNEAPFLHCPIAAPAFARGLSEWCPRRIAFEIFLIHPLTGCDLVHIETDQRDRVGCGAGHGKAGEKAAATRPAAFLFLKPRWRANYESQAAWRSGAG
jgi:hypothetical protein